MSKKVRYYQNEDAEIHKVEEAAVAYESPVMRINAIRSGLSPEFVIDLMESYRMSKQEASRLADISAKTLERHLQSGRRIQGLQSDRLLQLADLYNEGVDVFGSQDKFLKWLDTKSVALGHTAPREWLDTHDGITMISDELGRIRHGIFA